jgi:hypothetical protein
MVDRPGRTQWTLKSPRLTDEFRALVARAAKEQGQGINDYVVDVLTARSQEVIKARGGDPVAGPPISPPARLQDVALDLVEQFARLRQEQEMALAKIAAENRRGRWRRR